MQKHSTVEDYVQSLKELDEKQVRTLGRRATCAHIMAGTESCSS